MLLKIPPACSNKPLYSSWEGQTGISGTGFSSLLDVTGIYLIVTGCLLECYWNCAGILLEFYWNLLDFTGFTGFSENPVPDIPVGPGHG